MKSSKHAEKDVVIKVGLSYFITFTVICIFSGAKSFIDPLDITNTLLEHYNSKPVMPKKSLQRKVEVTFSRVELFAQCCMTRGNREYMR